MQIPDSWAQISAAKIISESLGGVNPSKAPGEIFELFSIPGYDIGKSEILSGREIGSNKQVVRAGQVLLSKINPRISRTWIVRPTTNYRSIASTEWIAFECKNIFLPEFIKYLLQTETIRGYLASKVTGSGGSLQRVNKATVSQISLPVPPISEQTRIVKKIESTEAVLRSIKTVTSNAENLAAKYRESILKRAFRGELTRQKLSDESAEQLIERIREKRESSSAGKRGRRPELPQISPDEMPFAIPNNWKWISLGDFSFVTKLAGFEYTKHVQLLDKGEVPVIRAQNVRKGYLDLSNLKYISLKVSNLLERCALTKKCLVMTFIGANIGDTAIIDPETRFHLAPNVAKIEADDAIYLDYLMHYLLSPDGRSQVFKSMKSTAQPSLSMTTIREVFVPLPPMREQIEISKILQIHFNSIRKISENIQTLKSSVADLERSILDSAFNGRLVTQLDTEGTGHELIQNFDLNEDARDTRDTEVSKGSKTAKRKARR
jgi:type I restriction enzyme S subunit